MPLPATLAISGGLEIQGFANRPHDRGAMDGNGENKLETDVARGEKRTPNRHRWGVETQLLNATSVLKFRPNDCTTRSSCHGEMVCEAGSGSTRDAD
jgi:hypothetical protein